MVRNALERGAVYQVRRRPGARAYVHVHHLHQGRADQVAPAGQDAAGLRPPNGFAPAEQHQVGPGFDKETQVAPGWQLRCRVHDHRQAVCVQRVDYQRQIGDGVWRCYKNESYRVGVDGCRYFPGFQPAHAGSSAAVVVPDVHDSRSGQAHRVVVAVAVGARHQHAVGHGRGVGQRGHTCHVPARQAGGGGQCQSGRRAGCDDAGLGTRSRGDHAAGRRLEFGNVYRSTSSLLHRLQHFGLHQAATQARQGAGRIDAEWHAQALVNIAHGPGPL